MLNAYDLLFQQRALEIGWSVTRVFGKIWTVVKPDDPLKPFFVHVKGTDDYLRPQQYGELKKLDGPVFIAVGGDPENLCPLDDFPRSFNARGRLPNSDPLSPNAMRQYKSKINALEKQFEDLRNNPHTPKALLRDIDAKLVQLRSKLIQTEIAKTEIENAEAHALAQDRETRIAKLREEELQRSSDAFDHLMEVAEKEGIKSKEEKDGTS